MQKALRYTDEKSDKFWRIETAGCELVTNWGKNGTTGRYEIKDFDTEDECEKQAFKLVRSKEKRATRTCRILTQCITFTLIQRNMVYIP